jgi:hypothetical protein
MPSTRFPSVWRATPADQELQRLEAELFELWGHLSAANYRFLELVAEFDRKKGYERHGVASCAQWLSWQCGIDSVTAREKVRVARALENLPKISDSFRRGVISYSKVRAMTRIACAENEDALLNIAEHGTAAHVAKVVRKYFWVERLEDAQRANAQHHHRYLNFGYDEDGSLLIRAKLPPEIGALVRKALETALALMEQHEDKELSDDTERRSRSGGSSEAGASAEARSFAEASAPAEARESEPFTVNDERGAKRADALRVLAERFLSARIEQAGSPADRYQLVVHVDQRVLATGSVYAQLEETGDSPMPERYNGPGRCELDDERALALETVRRLGCDCSLVGIVEDDDGEPLSVGRKTRSIPPALQRALKARDGGCRFPGCDRARFTEGHHVKHWADGGETKLSNLVTLCWFHHRLVHEGGFGLRTTDDGAFVFTRPDGTRVTENGLWRFRGSNSAQASVDALFERNLSRGVEIDAGTARCRWLGERLDYGIAIGHLIGVRNKLREVGRAAYSNARCFEKNGSTRVS